MPTAAQLIWSAQKLEPYMNPDDCELIAVALDVNLNLAQGTVLGEKLGTNAKQTLTTSGSPAATGSFTLTYAGQTTRSIPALASAAEVQKALEDITTIGQGNVRVVQSTVGANPVWTVEFIGALAAQVIAAMTHTDTATTITVATSQVGAAGTPGTFKAYNQFNTDGSQVAKLILPYAVQTDASGNITLSSTSGQAGNDLGMTMKSIGVYFSGTFLASELVGLDAKAVLDLGASFIQGKVGAGILRIP